MEKDPTQVLIAQFTQFAMDKELSVEEWSLATQEYGVEDKASEIERFYPSWKWGDGDRRKNTVELIEGIHSEDEELALSLMKRVCELAGGLKDDDLKKYPALESLSGDRDDVAAGLPTLTTTTDIFLDVENTPNSFYSDLITDINQCYRIGVYDATVVLTRKLLENQILDLLRKDCDSSEVDVYFVPENGQFRGFRALIEEFEERLDSYQPYSGGVNEELVRKVKRFKTPADAQAHTIEVSLSKEEVDELGNDAEQAVEILFRVRENMD